MLPSNAGSSIPKAIDAIAPAVETLVHAVALPIEPVIDTVRLSLQAFRQLVPTRLSCALRLPLETLVDALGFAVESTVDPVTPEIEAGIDAIAPVVEPLFNPTPPPIQTIAQVLIRVGQRGLAGQAQGRRQDNRVELDPAHPLFLPFLETRSLSRRSTAGSPGGFGPARARDAGDAQIGARRRMAGALEGGDPRPS